MQCCTPTQGVAGLSNHDSFIDEVTEEVRRDRLFAAFRKYGWIGVLLVAVSYTHLDVYKRQPQGGVAAGGSGAADCAGGAVGVGQIDHRAAVVPVL